MNIYAWSLSQLTFAHNPSTSDLSNPISHELLKSTLATLARCRELLNDTALDSIESMWNSPEGQLLLNGEAMLRVTYTRLFQVRAMPNGMALFLNTASEDSKHLAHFVSTEQSRGPLITKVMSNMCEALSVPSKAGYLLVQKAAAISWSVEHAVAGWGCSTSSTHLLSCHQYNRKLTSLLSGPALEMDPFPRKPPSWHIKDRRGVGNLRPCKDRA